MVQITQNIYQALPQKVPTTRVKQKMLSKTVGLFPMSMKEYLAKLEILGPAGASLLKFTLNPTFLNPKR